MTEFSFHFSLSVCTIKPFLQNFLTLKGRVMLFCDLLEEDIEVEFRNVLAYITYVTGDIIYYATSNLFTMPE